MVVNCPACTGPTRVINSRTVDSPAKGFDAGSRAAVEQLVGWYTPDWVVRTRACIKETCGARAFSVELYTTDFHSILKEGLPHGK